MLGLTVPQAAAALAATVVGFDIGLFDQSVVNAVLILILASIVVGTLLVDRSVQAVPAPEQAPARLGDAGPRRPRGPRPGAARLPLAARIAAPDSGVVHGLLASPPDEAVVAGRRCSPSSARRPSPPDIDAEPTLLVHESLPEGIVNAAAAERASLALVGQQPEAASAFGGGRRDGRRRDPGAGRDPDRRRPAGRPRLPGRGRRFGRLEAGRRAGRATRR